MRILSRPRTNRQKLYRNTRNCISHTLRMPIFYDNKLIRRDIYRENYLNINTIFSKNKQKDNITKVISFFEKTKVFERVCKLSKRDISPNRSTKRKREKQSEMDHPKKEKKNNHTADNSESNPFLQTKPQIWKIQRVLQKNTNTLTNQINHN